MKRALPILILILALLLRLRGLGHDSLWGDEVSTVLLARMSLAELIRNSVSWENIPPLHHVLLHFWIRIFGDSEYSVRMPSVIAGVASVFMAFVLVRRMLGQRIALAAMLLMAVSPVNIAYSQECRCYSLMVLLSLIATDLFVRLLRRPAQWLHVAYAVVAALSLYAHLYSLFTILAHHVLYALELSRRRRSLPLRPRAWLLDNLAAAALFGPWMPILLSWMRSVAQNFWNKSVTIDEIAHTYWIFSGSTAAFIVMLALVVIGAAQLRRAARRRRRRGLTLMLILLICPVIVPVIMSVLGRPVYAPRYAIVASVAMCALAATGVVALPRPIGAAALLIAAILGPLGHAADIPRAPWREATALLNQQMRPGDLAVVHCSAGKRLYDYYVHRPDIPRRATDAGSLPITLPLDGRRVWLIHFDAWYPLNSFVSRGNLRIERRWFSPGVVVVELTDEPAPAGAATTLSTAPVRTADPTPASPPPSAASPRPSATP